MMFAFANVRMLTSKASRTSLTGKLAPVHAEVQNGSNITIRAALLFFVHLESSNFVQWETDTLYKDKPYAHF